MSKERVNIRMDEAIFNFYDDMAKKEGLSRSEAMIKGLAYYKEKVEEDKLLKDTFESLEKLMDKNENIGFEDLANGLACKKGRKHSHKHIGRDLNSLNLILNSGEEGIKVEDEDVLEDLNKYNALLKNLSRPIEILTKNFNYHKSSLETIKKYSELILGTISFNKMDKQHEETCNRTSDIEALKREIKEEILKDLKKDF